MSLKHLGLPMLLVGVFAMSACGDDTSDPVDAGAKDTGVTPPVDSGTGPGDGGTTDTGFNPLDTGVGPRDASTPDTGVNVMPNTEGGSCTPDMTPQGSCPAGLSCVVWDVDDMGNPLASTCVRECGTDADCANSTIGSLCRNMGLSDSPFTICTAEEGVEDDLCIGSLLNGGPMRGCAQGLDCLASFFTDLEPYEGLCIKLCDPTGMDPNAVCTNADTPYCNPQFVTFTSTDGTQFDRGYCADGQHLAGAPCRSSGLTGRCDTDPASGDLGCVGGLTDPGTGVCFEFCSLADAMPTCAHGDPVLGTAECSVIDQGPACQNDGQCTSAGWDRCAPDGFCGINDGVCTIPCSSFPENCSGMGEPGLGKTCLGGIGFDLDGDGNFNGLDFCFDIVPPVLIETTLAYDASNMLTLQNQGDNCVDDILSCPDFTTCIGVMQGVAVCLRGCNTATSAADPRGGCETDMTRPNSLCSPDFGFTDPLNGVCADPM